ncbi:MAG: type II secretion system secretin GspD [Gammaproteobacteria bacterium]|nr:type II secretion system secretin GspD [Gammaproteobacteria bacterium]MCZ6912045.1 type II secretion system secretin GspD [Pseudomonadota bacterium]
MKNSGTKAGILCRQVLTTVVLGLVASQLVLAQQPSIRPNFQDVDIRQIIEAVAEVTGKNFIVDPRVNQKNVTMISQSAMSSDAFYNAFQSLLQVYGYIAVPSGNFIKILPDANARQVPGAPAGTGGPDEIVTRVIRIENVVAAQLVPILRPLIPQYGHLAAYPQSNMLIISDRAANVRRIARIVSRIDQEGEDDIEIIPLQHASAIEIVTIINSIRQPTGRDGGQSRSNIAADQRTNSVLIGGDSKKRLKTRVLIVSLDTPLAEGGNTRVRYLFNADAEELAGKLQEQIGAFRAQGAGGSPQTGPGDTPVIIWADLMTNALVITAPAKEMRNLMAIVDKLDIRRAQVQIDAIIVAVLMDKINDFGVSWLVTPGDTGDVAAVSEFSDSFDITGAVGALDGGEGAVGDFVGDGITGIVGRFRENKTSWAAVVTALAGDASTNILSQPSITTVDNEEAVIKVAQEVPFITGQFTNTGAAAGAVNPFQTIQREEVGTILRITPQINEGNAVLLKVEQEQSTISQGAQGAVDLITNKRTISTNVIVEDGGIIVLGGLIEETLIESEQRVPILGKIPILGALFRTRKTELVKTNLMVFIRPTILRDGVQATLQSNARYNFMRELQLGSGIRQGGVQMMPGEDRPALPAIDSSGRVIGGPIIDARQSADADEEGDDGS